MGWRIKPLLRFITTSAWVHATAFAFFHLLHDSHDGTGVEVWANQVGAAQTTRAHSPPALMHFNWKPGEVMASRAS